MTDQLQARGIEVMIGQMAPKSSTAHDAASIDWFVYTSAPPADHAELVFLLVSMVSVPASATNFGRIYPRPPPQTHRHSRHARQNDDNWTIFVCMPRARHTA